MTKYTRIPTPDEVRVVDAYAILSVATQDNGLSILTLDDGLYFAVTSRASVGDFLVVDKTPPPVAEYILNEADLAVKFTKVE